MLVMFPTKKKKENPQKKATLPLTFAMLKSSSKFKSIFKKKRKRGNISNVFNQKKKKNS
jgi:hypothetical protein